MKKGTRVFLIAVLFVMAAGCINGGIKQDVTEETNIVKENVLESNSDNESEETATEISDEKTEDIKEESVSEPLDENEITESDSGDEVTSEGSDDIDVDLTAISGILVYSEVYNMMSTPENYKGKKIKMEGTYTIYFDDTYSTRYDACIVQDATACCATGIEFELSDELKFPDDYPKEGETITVEGIFDTYDEGSYTYCTLRNASLLNVEKQ